MNIFKLMNNEQAYEALERIKDRGVTDTEEDHREADQILCSLLMNLGYEDVVRVYESITKWYD